MKWDDNLEIFAQDGQGHVRWSYAPDHDMGGAVDVYLEGRWVHVCTDDDEGNAMFPAPLARLIAHRLLALADAIYPPSKTSSPSTE